MSQTEGRREVEEEGLGESEGRREHQEVQETAVGGYGVGGYRVIKINWVAIIKRIMKLGAYAELSHGEAHALTVGKRPRKPKSCRKWRKLGIRGRFTNLFRKEKGGERREGRERGRRRREEKEEDKMNFGRVSRFCVWK